MSSEINLQEIVSYLDDLLRVSCYDEGAPSNGLMLDAGRRVARIAAALNTSFTTIRGTARIGAELLLVHHTTWASIDLHLKEEKEAALRAAGVSLYSAHVALDAHPQFGSSDTLARRLGVRIEGRFAPYCGGQVGVYGQVDGTFPSFAEQVRAELGVPVDQWENCAVFGRVGIVTGGGNWTTFMNEARSLGCDTFLTGESSMYTKLFAREAGMNLIIATHYATEVDGIQALADAVARHFQLPWEFVREDPDIL